MKIYIEMYKDINHTTLYFQLSRPPIRGVSFEWPGIAEITGLIRTDHEDIRDYLWSIDHIDESNMSYLFELDV